MAAKGEHKVRPYHLVITARTGKRYVPYLRRHVLRASRILASPLGELSLALVGDARMAQLHEQFLAIAGPTDVLTFPLEHNKHGRVTSGEIVICVPEASRQARAAAHRVERELLLYAVHGLLHLCGYNDKTPRDFRRMHRTEDMILTQLGVGPVFSAARGDPHKGARRP